MLGSAMKRQRRSWNWTAVGKHPAVMDHIHLGAGSPLMDALADWAAKGYDAHVRTNGASENTYSWRFWLRGVRKGNLICGLGCDSHDRIGCLYPLMIMGEGVLDGWEEQWAELLVQLNPIWKRLEYIAAHRFKHTRDIESALNRVAPPEIEISSSEGLPNNDHRTVFDEIATVCHRQLRSYGYGMMNLSDAGSVDADEVILKSHGLLKACCQDIPSGVFIGGTSQQTFISVFQHPLGTPDFIRLWTV